ncbi:hypothetical protein D3C79_1093430 [compost metagenome]
MDAQFLGPFGDGVVVLLQFVLGFTRRFKAFQAACAGDELHGGAQGNGQQD